MNSRKCGEIIRAYRNVFLHIYRRGILPKIQRLDNKCSHILKDEIGERQVHWQLVPLGIHRRNSAQRAIRTLNNHFKEGLETTDK